ncbi:AAA family ATPase [Massilia sp. ZL223]|uniref:AAA family ATPase n=1 Tax=Massilia sp. ZL223 TaxID=2824904 RepID=UPI001B842EF3|nr:AAA family ATPase [Massilia sp. ZL223]MBQ5965448.1 AAA family ATPase [Massilia sp. ZL223]
MTTFLHGLSLKNYRGIGQNVQRIGPFKKCNFFIGTNNSGKSCVLNFLSAHLAELHNFGGAGNSRMKLLPLEVHLGATAEQVQVGLAVPTEWILENSNKFLSDRSRDLSSGIGRIFSQLITALAENGLVWIEASATGLQESMLAKGSHEYIRLSLSDSEWRLLWSDMTGSSGGDVLVHHVPQVISKLLSRLRTTYPSAKLVPAKRQIGVAGNPFEDFSGAGLIDRLAELQNPGPTERHLKMQFSKINDFLRDVTGDESAMIEIPHDRKEVLVHKGSKVLPLSSLGTGIHEVVMIAAFCTLTEKAIICIEEPEIHLHPLLQKKLINYIHHRTDNQYFIATHSASIIDQENSAIFHVTHKDGSTEVELVTASAHRMRICQDLGYRASDLLQTNAIIWVEGPSDRIYLNHWISAVNSQLKEGIHYSIMFYGGRLLSHLSASDEDVSDFIALRRLNQNMAIVIDSDKRAPQTNLNDTKKRIIHEFSAFSDPAWVTAGREIENYIPSALLEKTLGKIYTSFDSVQSSDRYSHRLPFRRKGTGGQIQDDVDKIKVAREVCNHPADLTMYDLEAQVRRVVTMIENAN